MSWFDNNRKPNAWLSKQWVKLYSSDKARSGATSIEYAVIASLIAVVIVGALHALSGNVLSFYDALATAIGAAI